MKKSEERKLRQTIIDQVGENITDADYILIGDVIDWIKINEYAKNELQAEVKGGDSMNWQTLTKIAMCSKNIVAILQRLNITPEKKSKNRKVDKDKKGHNLQEFLDS